MQRIFNVLRWRNHYIYNEHIYLTIRLRAWDFYEVIVDEGEARINYHLIEIESYLIVIVESTIKHEILKKNWFFNNF